MLFKVTNRKSKPLMPNKVIFRKEGHILTTGNFIQLTGQAKTCKTSVLMELVKSLVDGKSRLGFDFESCPKDMEVVFINTELSAYDLWQQYDKICAELGYLEDIPNLKFFDAQSMSASTKKKGFQEYLKEGKPYVIIIDGIVDFVDDFNNQRESKEITDLLLSTCAQYSCSMIVTLHQNPSAFGTKSRGHLGTYIEQKASGTLCTVKTKNSFKLKGDKLRNSDTFEIKFHWTEAGLSLDTSTTNFKASESMLSLFEDTIVKSELIKKYCIQNNVTKPTAYTVLEELKQDNLVTEKVISQRKSNIIKCI